LLKKFVDKKTDL